MQSPTRIHLMLSALILLFLIAFTNSCETHRATESSSAGAIVNHQVASPNPKWDVPFEKHTLEAGQSQQIQTQSGSIIGIPAGVLVDGKGNPATGEAEIQYREFHTAADIFRSGIPMRYDSVGTSHILKSAGMFEIRATQQGEPLYIAEGKQIDVQMKTTKSGSYNFYKLNEAGDNNWQFIQSATAVVEAPISFGDSISPGPNDTSQVPPIPKELVKPEKADENAVVFDFKTNYQVYSELAKYKNVLWQDAERPAKGTIDIAKNDWIFGEVWAEATVKRARLGGGNFYYLDLRNAEKKARLLVKPVIEGKAYQQAMATYQQDMAERKRLIQKYKQEAQEAIQAERAALASGNFYSGIRSFGFYNWDLIIKKGALNMLAADFYFENGKQPDEVYLIIPDAPVAVKFNKMQWANFTYSQQWESMVVALLPGDRLAIIEGETLKAAQDGKGTQKFTFQENVRVSIPNQIAEFFAP